MVGAVCYSRRKPVEEELTYSVIQYFSLCLIHRVEGTLGNNIFIATDGNAIRLDWISDWHSLAII